MVTMRMIVSCFKKDRNFVYYTEGRIKIHPCLETSDYSIAFIPLPRKDYGIKSTFRDMMALRPSNFIAFQDYVSDNIYLFYNFYRKKINVSLVQDGYKPYPIWHRKRLPLVIAKETMEIYLQMAKRKALIPSFFLRSYKYGKLRYIHELWLEYPDKLPHYINKPIIKIPDFNEESKALCFKLFNYQENKSLQKVILYIGQSLKTDDLRRKEIEIIEQLLSRHSDYSFIYRPHPLVSKEQMKFIHQIKGILVFDKVIPIELLMISMKDSIIVSTWSAALLTNNKECRYYWIYRLLTDNFAQKMQIEIVNPTNHIIEVNSLEEII